MKRSSHLIDVKVCKMIIYPGIFKVKVQQKADSDLSNDTIDFVLRFGPSRALDTPNSNVLSYVFEGGTCD